MTGIQRDYDDPDKGWFKLRHAWTRDVSIDWGALGLLAYLTSHKDGFEVALEAVTGMRKSKRFKVMGWLEELERAGYIERETQRRSGLVVGTVWHLKDPNAGDQHQLNNPQGWG